MILWRLSAACPDGEVCFADVPIDFNAFNMPLAEAVGLRRLIEERLYDAFLVIRDELEKEGYMPVPKLPPELEGRPV